MKFLQNDERCAMRACDAEDMLPPPPKQAERRAAREAEMMERTREQRSRP